MNIQTVCVCGAGTMGSGITLVSAQSGFYSIQFDLSEQALDNSKTAIDKNLQYLLSKQKITEQEKIEILQRIKFTTNLNDCIADIIIEAIIEKKEAKINLFNQLAEINHSETIFATNTSSISVSDIAAGVMQPSRVVGMHFFNPANIMKLVEVVSAQQTKPEVATTVYELAKQMNKNPVMCADAPGFIINRVARHYYLEAMYLVEQDLASIETVDAVLENAGFKMGPFKLMDLIGMDINYSVSKIVWDALGKPERLTPSNLQKQKIESGNLGRKTGQGFYTY